MHVNTSMSKNVPISFIFLVSKIRHGVFQDIRSFCRYILTSSDCDNSRKLCLESLMSTEMPNSGNVSSARYGTRKVEKHFLNFAKLLDSSRWLSFAVFSAISYYCYLHTWASLQKDGVSWMMIQSCSVENLVKSYLAILFYSTTSKHLQTPWR